ncbi:hypothetical protein DL98DRAFT_452026 [Cadophora sp. DSE1049]|nr:hypothetical protein DL98DRAFT_452026 [Cadophora sp. DSE1049]
MAPTRVERFLQLVMSRHFAWFVGHLIVISATVYFFLALVQFNSWGADLAYRAHFSGALLSYSIVVYGEYKKRVRWRKDTRLSSVLADENMQHLLIIIPLFLYRRFPLTILRQPVYSAIHISIYVRRQILGVLFTNAGEDALAVRINDVVGSWVKNRYDASMKMVCVVELGLWLHILFAVLTFEKHAWILWVLCSGFLRARMEHSPHIAKVQTAVAGKLDVFFGDERMPLVLRRGWEDTKDVWRQIVEITDLEAYGSMAPVAGGEGKKDI